MLDHTVKYNGVFYYAGQELPNKVASEPVTEEQIIDENAEAPKKRGRKKAED